MWSRTKSIQIDFYQGQTGYPWAASKLNVDRQLKNGGSPPETPPISPPISVFERNHELRATLGKEVQGHFLSQP